jgi:glyoxylase-like metal-dependent hydrolase (beta-lactamase superfamily II)
LSVLAEWTPGGSSSDWTRPGAEEISERIFRIPLPLPSDGLKAVNAYLILDSGGPVLIDPGWSTGPGRTELERQMRRVGIGPSEIRRSLVTHVHRDHYTQAVALRREFGTPIALGIGEEASVRSLLRPETKPLDGVLEVLRRAGAVELAQSLGLEQTYPDPEDYESPDQWLQAPVDVELADRTLGAIATPGHTQGHVVFHDAQAGLLFAGDHVLPHITPSVGFEPVQVEAPLRDYIASLQLMREIPDTRLLPAHGPVIDSTHARVVQLLDHHDVRLAQMQEIALGGAATAWDVALQMPWTRRQRPFTALDAFNQMMAVLETESHLQVLAAQGKLRAVHTDGRTEYVATPVDGDQGA